MGTITIRGIRYQPEEFEDRDLVAIATLAAPNAYTIERSVREREAVAAMRLIFPTLAEGVTRGDRLRLSMAEINQLVQDLMLTLLDNPQYRAVAETNPDMAPLLEMWAQGNSDSDDDDELESLRPEIEEFDAEDDEFLASIAEQIAAAKDRTSRKAARVRRSSKAFRELLQ